MISSRRGQTTLDFAVGASMFLLALIFVIAYAPTMFDPFAGGTGTKLIVADRAATTLAGDVLATSTAEPGSLSIGCVAGFFDGDGDQSAVDEHCTAAIDDVRDLDGTLSLEGRHANVSIHEIGAPASVPAEPSWAPDDLNRGTGTTIPSDVAVATRTVSIGGDRFRLTVQVW